MCWFCKMHLETHLELNDEHSSFIGIPVDRHALILNTFDVIVLDDFS